MIHHVALGVALRDADNRVQEEGGNNRGPWIRQYLDNVDPPIAIAAPWCAAFVQYCSDVAARALGIPNPLDDVKHEALVQSYADWFTHAVVDPWSAEPGDLVLFSFGGERWDHIGFVVQRPTGNGFFTCEGNTGVDSERDGDGVSLKPRLLTDGEREPKFIRWHEEPID